MTAKQTNTHLFIKINIYCVTGYSEIIVIYIQCHIFAILHTHSKYANSILKTYNFESEPQHEGSSLYYYLKGMKI